VPDDNSDNDDEVMHCRLWLEQTAQKRAV
jgi:hypothetical protein